MDEPYTVGIRLALDDEVSAGLSLIRDQLTALDRVIDATRQRLDGLRAAPVATELDTALRAATHIAAPVQPQPATSTSDPPAPASLPSPPATPPAPPVRLTPPGQDVVAPPVQSTTPPAPQPQIRLAAPLAPSPDPSPRSISTPETRPDTSYRSQIGSVLTQPSAPASTQRPQIDSPPQPLPKSNNLVRQSADTRATAFTVAPPAQTISPAPSQATPSPAAPPLREARFEGLASPSPSPFAATRQQAAAPEPIRSPPARSTAPQPLPQSAAPAAPITQQTAPERPALAPLAQSFAPPPPAPTQTGPNQGDVYLDGVRMGRWMSSHLAREASRPPAGSTAFDPRLGITWPGALQGN